jgi:hypothetical protein
MLRAVRLGGMRITPEALLDLLILETGDEQLAQRLASKYAFDCKVAEAEAEGG